MFQFKSVLTFLVSIFTIVSCQASQDSQLDTSDSYKVIDEVEVNFVQENSVYWFIGYRDRQPVFKNQDKNDSNLYLLKDDEFQIMKTSDTHLNPLFINNEVVVYLNENSQKGYEIVISYNNDIDKIINLPKKPISLSANENGTKIFYQDDFSYIKLFDVEKEVLNEVFLEGYYPKFVEGDIYFVEESDAGPALVNLKKVSLNALGEVKEVIGGIYEEGLFISPDGKMIACSLPNQGKVVPAVYSVEKQAFHLLKEKQIDATYYPILDCLEGKLLYYKPKGLEIVSVKLPEEYNYKN